MNKGEKIKKLKEIEDELLCLKKSPLYNYRNQNKYFPVAGEGSHNADIIFIGEAPGRNEAQTGRPFCGTAGKVLDKLLCSVGINREDVFITNIVKDRPPENRDPSAEEIEVYGPLLDRQIETIRPKIIATLGRYSMAYIMEKFGLGEELGTIGELHGKEFSANSSFGPIKLAIFYHPCAAVYDPRKIDMLKKDFQILKKLSKNK